MPAAFGPPPPELIRSLVDGPSLVTDVVWFDEVDSTNRVVADAARDGTAEGLLAVADTQTAGRGRMGRAWIAPPGTSLLLSVLLRPHGAQGVVGTLPLLVGLVVAETVSRHLPQNDVALKWPNDLLVDGAKAAGVLLEVVDSRVVVGLGIDVDWRDVERPAELDHTTSLSESGGSTIDRWRLLAGVVGVLSNRYAEFNDDPTACLPDYRDRCATIGRDVVVHLSRGSSLRGQAVDVDDAGRLVVRTAEGEVVAVTAGDVEHVRPA